MFRMYRNFQCSFGPSALVVKQGPFILFSVDQGENAKHWRPVAKLGSNNNLAGNFVRAHFYSFSSSYICKNLYRIGVQCWYDELLGK